MQDSVLLRIIMSIIQQGLIDDGFNGVVLQQSYQPTMQGVTSPPTVYFFKVGDKRYGFPYRKDTWDTFNDIMVHTEIEDYETTFQVGARVYKDPRLPDQYTASDLVNEVSAILQSDSTVNTLEQNNIGILRIIDIRNPYFVDDRDQFETFPNFDFILTHQQIRTKQSPVISSYEYNIKRV